MVRGEEGGRGRCNERKLGSPERKARAVVALWSKGQHGSSCDCNSTFLPGSLLTRGERYDINLDLVNFIYVSELNVLF